MEYPVWNVLTIGTPWIVGITAIVHVFVSHFAVGGGAYLYFTERRAVRDNDEAMREHVRRYTKFFYYLTTVFGVVTGVGIWFAIGLASAPGTSMLIKTFVFLWAAEWVFFAVEIATIVVYYYTWDSMDKRTHVALARMYFLVSIGTLFIINGILCFMLTPGKWLETGSLWHAFFNPTYWPSLFIRLSLMIAVAGLFGIAVATRIKDNELLRTKLVRFSASYAVPLFFVVPVLILVYLKALPEDVVYNMKLGIIGPMAYGNFSTLSRMMIGAGIISILLVAFTFIGPFTFPRNATTFGAVILLLMAFACMALSEWSREAARKPYVIYGYMYSNGIRVDDAEKYATEGFLRHAKWVQAKSAEGLEGEYRTAAGAELFRTQCMACHTTNGYRAMSKLLGERDEEAIRSFIDGISYGNPENAYFRYMPPFLGTPAERDALASYLATLNTGSSENDSHSKPAP